MDSAIKQIRSFGRALYAIAIGGIGIQQLCEGDFVNYIGAAWPHHFTGYKLIVYAFSIMLLIISITLLIGRPLKKPLIALGIILLVFDIFSQVPFLYLVLPHKKTHLGVWAFVLKELAIAGGAFITAQTETIQTDHLPMNGTTHLLSLVGSLFFSITMFCFGCAHFLYPDATAALIPSWIPGAQFWVYLTGAALIMGSLVIVLRVMAFPASFLLGCMIFTWFWTIHIPSVVYHPLTNQSNEISAAFSALAFSGTAFMISGLFQQRPAGLFIKYKAWV